MYTFTNCNMSSFIIVFILLTIFSKQLKGDVSEVFDNILTIESPIGTLFPGEKAQFVCIAKKFEGQGELIWHWHFTNQSIFYTIDPETDELDRTKDHLIRRSVIRIPKISWDGGIIAYIGCELSSEGRQLHKKLVALDILEIPKPPSRSHGRQRPQETTIYPQIALELYGSEIRRPSEVEQTLEDLKPHSYQYHPPYLVTNKSINLSPDAKSIRLSCIIPKQDKGEYQWIVSSGDKVVNASKKKSTTPRPSISLILSQLSLIYREAAISGRLPPAEINCRDNTTNSNRLQFQFIDTVYDTLEVIISPLVAESETLTYTCKPIRSNISHNLGYTTITLLATRAGVQRDQEFIELINILMQILQNSSGPDTSGGSGSSSGPLYGVGFGSSSIMILMGLTIYYLKRQLNQIQEQVKEHDEERKRLKQPSRTIHTTESVEL